MTEYNLRRSLQLLKRFVFHNTADAFRGMSKEHDVPGSLLVLDAISFLSVVVASASGIIEPSLSWGFIVRFIVLYMMVLVVFVLLVGFEAGVAVAGARLISSRVPRYLSLYSAFGYAKLPLVVAALMYIFLPVRLDLTAVIDPEGANVIMCALMDRAELFEAMAFVLGVIGVRTVALLSVLQSFGIVLLGWLLGTPIFYCVLDVIRG
ncbi:MAG: hypothetical protein KAR83_10455 [Thermodesulfovibrionales bacterium]|nr:hypothetical protein [Thermodesulfovibrionales bacterium]